MTPEQIAAGLSGVQRHDILAGTTAPHAGCPAPTLTSEHCKVWRLSRSDDRWYLTPLGLEVRAILEQDHG